MKMPLAHQPPHFWYFGDLLIGNINWYPHTSLGSPWRSVVGRIMPPKIFRSSLPKPVNVALHGKTYFVQVIKLRVLRWRDDADDLCGH